MTDKEIIKALELCMDEDDRCGECPYEGSPERCVKVHGKDLLDLINRQKAENERLETNNLSIQKTLSKMSLGVEQARAEAIKDFADDLMARAYLSSNWSNSERTYVVEVEDINTLVDEKIGGNNESIQQEDC